MSDLEQRLRELLRDDRYALPAWSDPVARVRSAVQVRRRRRAALVAVVTTVVVLLAVPVAVRLAAGGESRPAGPVTPGSEAPTFVVPTAPVPWEENYPSVDNPGLPNPGPQPTTAPCSTGELSATLSIMEGGAATGHASQIVFVHNVGSTRCTLQPGTVRLLATDVTAGRPVTITAGARTFFDPPDAERPPTLDPRQSARLHIATSMGCNGGSGAHTYRLDALETFGRRYPLNGGATSVQSSCPIEVGPWFRQLPGYAVPDPERAAPGPFAALRAVIHAPDRAKATDSVAYTVVLGNPTDTAVQLSPCPVYVQAIDLQVDRYVMHCAVLAIPPHAAVAFSMVLHLPIVGAGPERIWWGIEQDTGYAAVAHADIEITTG